MSAVVLFPNKVTFQGTYGWSFSAWHFEGYSSTHTSSPFKEKLILYRKSRLWVGSVWTVISFIFGKLWTPEGRLTLSAHFSVYIHCVHFSLFPLPFPISLPPSLSLFLSPSLLPSNRFLGNTKDLYILCNISLGAKQPGFLWNSPNYSICSLWL